MKSIDISEDVYREIEKRCKLRETENDVLRRVLKLPEKSRNSSNYGRKPKPIRIPNKSKDRLSAWIESNQLHLKFQSGNSESWDLPSKNDKAGIREVRDQAVTFAEDYGATEGQVNAVKKALTNKGYYLMR
jgi:negative regulator of replication initiation